MADVAGVTSGAVEQAPAGNDPAADTGGHDHGDVVVDPTGGTDPALPQRQCLGIVVDMDTEAERGGQAAAEGKVHPRGDVQRRHAFTAAGTEGHRAAAPHSADHLVALPYLLDEGQQS